jgi:hypothetical protein
VGRIGSIDGSGGFARGVWTMLRDGGVWTVPRCGLLYQKHEEEMKLALVSRLPWSEGMPFEPDELREFQDYDHEQIGKLFGSVGVEVVEAT